jgi:hypothetical protein
MVASITWIYPVADLSDPRFSSAFRFETVVMLALAFCVWRVNPWVACFLIMAWCSSVFPFSTRYSVMAFRAVLVGVLWYYCIIHIFTVRSMPMLQNAMCIIALCNVLMLGFQSFGIDPIFRAVDGTGARPVGLLANRNETAALLAFCFPAFLRPRWRYLAPVIVISMIATRSSGGLVSVMAGSILLCLFYARFAWAAGLTALAIIAALCFQAEVATSFVVRWPAWMLGIKLYTQHWLFGSGLGHWKAVFVKYHIFGGWFKTAHNEYLQMLFETGIFGASILVGYAARLIRQVFISAPAPKTVFAMAIIMVNALFNFPFHIAATAMVAIAWMAIFEIETTKRNPETKNT